MSLYDKILTKELLEKIYKEEGGLKPAARKLGVDPGTIKRYMEKYNLSYRERLYYSHNEDFFSTITEESMYLAGFLAADGYINSKRNKLQIGLGYKDKKFLKKIKNLLEAENPIHTYLIKNSKRNSKWSDTKKVEIQITAHQLIKDLKKFNIANKKTHNYTIPKWIESHPLKHHFIRGYFDGDGSFYFHKKEDHHIKQFHFSLRGTKECLDSIRKIFEDELDLPKQSLNKKPRKNSGICSLEYGGNGILRQIISYLYKDATVYMERKYNLVQEIFSLPEKEKYENTFTKDLLEKEYEKYQSIQKIADKYKVSARTIHKYLKVFNIKTQESPNEKSKKLKLLLTKDNIENAYIEAGSARKAAKKLGVGATTLKRYADKYNIKFNKL